MKRIRKISQYDDKLKRCPFCGSPTEMVRAYMITGMVFIRCKNDDCGADVVFSGCELSEEKSLKRYNTRNADAFDTPGSN